MMAGVPARAAVRKGFKLLCPCQHPWRQVCKTKCAFALHLDTCPLFTGSLSRGWRQAAVHGKLWACLARQHGPLPPLSWLSHPAALWRLPSAMTATPPIAGAH